MKKSKSELLERFFLDAIENDYADLLERNITAVGFDKNPVDDPEYVNHAIYHHSRKSLEYMLKHNFSLLQSDLLKNLYSAISWDNGELTPYREVFKKAGKDHLTELAKSMFDNEGSKNNKHNPFYYLSMRNVEDNDVGERLDLALSYIDIAQLSDDDIVSAFRHEGIYSKPHCLLLLKYFDEQGRFNNLNEEQRSQLFSHLSKSDNTASINFCFKRGIFSKSAVLTREKEDSPSFFLITELFYAGTIDGDFITKMLGDGFSTEYYLKRFLSQFSDMYRDDRVTLEHPSIKLYCDLVSENIMFNSQEFPTSVALEALLKNEDTDVLTYMLQKILTEAKCDIDKLLNTQSLALIYKVSKRRSNESFMEFIMTNEVYIKFVQSMNRAMSEYDSQSSYNYIKSDKLYFVGANQDSDMPYTKTMLKIVPPTQPMLSGMIHSVLHHRPDASDFELGQQLLEAIYPYLEPETKAREFRRVYWTTPDNFSLSREFAALESSKTNEKKFERLIAIAFCNDEHVTTFLSNAKRGKNSDERIKLLLTLRCIDPFAALTDYSLSPKASETLSELISEL